VKVFFSPSPPDVDVDENEKIRRGGCVFLSLNFEQVIKRE
jgi:hypothetical protein